MNFNMKAAWYEQTGPAANVLRIGELPLPQPGSGEVLVKVHASGINPSDTKMRAGWRNTAMAFPRIVPHADGAGEVVAIGPAADSALLHRRVWVYNATALYDASRGLGTAAEYCALPAGQVVPLADGTAYEQGACLGVPACTAHRAVFSEGPVDGQTILVQGGAGCVAHYAIQLATLSGARVIATVRKRLLMLALQARRTQCFTQGRMSCNACATSLEGKAWIESSRSIWVPTWPLMCN